MKRIIVLAALAAILASCSDTGLDPTKYYVVTETTALIDPESGYVAPSDRTVEAGSKVMLLQNKVTAADRGFVRVVTDDRYDFGVLKLDRVSMTAEAIAFPEGQIFANNVTELFFVLTRNSDFDRTFKDSYRLSCILPATTRRAEVRTPAGKAACVADFAPYLGYKYAEFDIDVRSIPFGETEFSVVAYGKDGATVGSRAYRLRRDDASSRMVSNGERDNFRYRVEGNTIFLERFFGYSENDEDMVNYAPDFNQYVIEGANGYSYVAGIEVNQTKDSIDEIPLTMRFMRAGGEQARFDLAHYELTPSWGLECEIVEYPNAVVVLCAPPFEGAPRIVIFNKATNRAYDAWSILQENGIKDFHSCFEASVGETINLREVPFHFDYSDKPFVTYVIDINTDAIIRIEE